MMTLELSTVAYSPICRLGHGADGAGGPTYLLYLLIRYGLLTPGKPLTALELLCTFPDWEEEVTRFV